MGMIAIVARLLRGRSARGVAPEAAWKWSVLTLTFVSLLFTASSQPCKPRNRDNTNPNLLLGAVNESRPLDGFSCDYWTLPTTAVDNDDSCGPGQSYLLFEFWRLNDTNSVDEEELQNVYFLVARGTQPSVSYNGNKIVFAPSLGASPQNGTNGTLVDSAAFDYWRSYHRVIVPRNANITDTGGGTSDWYVTVANMVEMRYSVPAYTISVSCFNESATPCPRPSPSDVEVCSGNGACRDPPQGVARPSLNPVCYCDPNWGDWGCQRPATTLDMDDEGFVSAVLRPQEWAYWQLSAPLPNPRAKPTLLVELSRSYVGAGGAGFGASPASSDHGGNPMLIVMPKGVNDSNRVPWFSDLKQYGDLRSYLLEQNFHYILLREMPSTLQSDPGGAKTVEYYVAVYNDVRSSRDRPLLYQTANVTLRVRWRSGVASADSIALCPGNCFGGTCYDPWDPSVVLPDPMLPPVPALPIQTQDFQCACPTGFGGTMCEGSMRNLNVTTSGDGGRGALQPGQWSFFVLSIDPRRFDYNDDDVAIQWAVHDLTPDPASAYVNAYLTVDMQNFPRTSQLDSGDPFKRGYLVFYSSLAQGNNAPQPLQIKGSDLRQGYTYVLGLYNSDYVRQAPYEYSVSVYVPTTVRTWLHPYMSVVLGVTASIILCLLMTLCRRLLQRYGWGPFRPRADGAPGPNAQRMQVGQMQPRPQGIPAEVIDSFYSYEYSATKAEKLQLSRSRRDHEAAAPQPPQPQPPRPGELQPQGRASRSPSAARTPPPPQPQPNTIVPFELTPITSNAATTSSADGVANIAAVSEPPAVATSASAMAVAVTTDPLLHVSTIAASGGAGGGAATTSTAGSDDDEPQCSVCLCEYEEGERITRLPCRHEFHGTCITKWLQTHHTCPICRVSLLPEQSSADEEGEQQEAAAPDGQQQLASQQAVAAGAADGGGAVVAPVGPPAAAEAAAAAPAGIFSLIMGSMRRMNTNTDATRASNNQLVEPLPLQQQVSQRLQGTPQRSGGVGEAVVQYEPAPATLVASVSGAGDRGGYGGTATIVTVVSAAPPVGAPQLVARGPTATLESSPGANGGVAGFGAASGRSPVSPNRLAAGRLTPSSSQPVPLGADGGGPGGRGWITPVRDAATLPQQFEVDRAEPPGLSPSTRSPHAS